MLNLLLARPDAVFRLASLEGRRVAHSSRHAERVGSLRVPTCARTPEETLTFFSSSTFSSNARLTANRSLRVRKVCSYVADKLNLRAMSRAPSIADGLNTYGTSPTRPSPAMLPPGAGGEYNPETGIEILVNGEVLPNNVTIGTVRHCMWKSGGDVVFTYRLKEPRGTV